MNKKTKIMATIGPASESEDVIRQLINNGVNIFRFNLKHNVFDWHKTIIDRTKEIANKMKVEIGILIDFQGPEIRIETENEQDIDIEENESLFVGSKFDKKQKIIKINPSIATKKIKVGDVVYLNNGDLRLKVVRKNNKLIELKSESKAIVKNKKSMNLVSRNLDLPILANRDLETLARLDQIKPDYIALSFVRSKNDIEVLKTLLSKIDNKVKIVAKIENLTAIENIEEIIDVSDGIMIARGDLGIEVPIKELAFWQKKIIDLCRKESKPVIVATQMLGSMVENLQPTRAEATDVSNAVFDGTDILMLSEETSIGKHPVKVVKEMSEIANFCENAKEIRNISIQTDTPTEVLIDAAVKIILNNKNLKIKAVVIFTESGKTARIFSRYRLNLPIIAMTDKRTTVKSLILSYGVESYYKKFNETNFRMPKSLLKNISSLVSLNTGDTLIVIHGNNWMESESTSDISLVTV
jgi:pyruvate kinase